MITARSCGENTVGQIERLDLVSELKECLSGPSLSQEVDGNNEMSSMVPFALL